MKIVVFTGPTLNHREGKEMLPEATFLEPAMQGDIFNAYRDYKPDIIVLIDGYYENVPSVWHKEILYVMSQGCHVYGAASMGALRAAELHDFGMKGHGRIFEWYKTGILEDDDEVALLHGPNELEYPAISEPLVNIRATVEKSVAENIIDERIATRILSISKSMFYKSRSFMALKEEYGRAFPSDSAHAIFEWLETNRINQKKLDASDLLMHISRLKKDEFSSQKVLYSFSETVYWRRSIELSN